MQAWIEQAADHMKVVDPNHMVTIGEEGFYGFGASAAQLATNPNSDNTGYDRIMYNTRLTHISALLHELCQQT